MGVLMFQYNFSYKNRSAQAADSWSNSGLKHDQADTFSHYHNEGGQQQPQLCRDWTRKETSEGVAEENHLNIHCELHVSHMSYMCKVM